jgi:hypothetical protein
MELETQFKKCTRKECYAQRQSDDNLFCSECRQEWRNHLDQLGLARCFDDGLITGLLVKFQQGV